MTSSRNATPAWRQFEKLIALIESHLAPQGAVIKSPDHISDKTTISGQPREVDASIRYQVGSVPILITIECRDRTSEQDVTWIEQLASKRDSIGASVMVAVSSVGFTQPALEKARFYGIETRLLREVSEDAIHNWAQTIDILTIRGKFGMGLLRLQLKATSDNLHPELHPNVKTEYAKGDVEYKFIRRTVDQTLISIGDLLREAELQAGQQLFDQMQQNVTVQLPPHSSMAALISSKFPSLFEDVPVGGEPVTKIRAWRFEPNEATVETEGGPAEIEYLDVELHVVQQVFPSNVGRLLSYEGESKRILNVEERNIVLGNDNSIKVIISGKPHEIP